MKTIFDGDLKLATVVHEPDIAKGLNWYSEDGDFIQIGTANFNKGKRIANHVHNKIKREINRTQEVICIIRGRVKIFVYSEAEKLIEEFILYAGDFIIYWNGGHGFKVMEDNTILLEVKNGPFLGTEKDKRRI